MTPAVAEPTVAPPMAESVSRTQGNPILRRERRGDR
jgi:hypothetical protein